MQINREDLNRCTVKLTVVCDTESVKSGFDKARKQLSKLVRLPGFRPGHAPKQLVEQYLDKGDLYEAAAQNIVGSAFKEALKQESLEPDPTVKPHIDVTKLEEDACEFDAKVGLPAVVELGDYKGLPATKANVEVTEQDIDYHVNELRKGKSTRETITERGVEEGDVAIVQITPDGEDTARKFMTKVGQTFASLDAALPGMRVEDVKHMDLSFPENFQEKDWAGKMMPCTIMLNSLSAVRMPEVDDEFAKSLSTDSVDELRNKIREGLSRAYESQSGRLMADELLQQLLDRSKVEVSDNAWEPIAEQRLGELQVQLRKEGKTIEEFVAGNGITVDGLRERWRNEAFEEVKKALLIREIYKTEDMKLENHDLDQALKEMAEEAETTPKEMIQLLEKADAMYELKFRAMSNKVREFLVEHAEVRELAGSARA